MRGSMRLPRDSNSNEILRLDHRGVSPVIATILLVAITVVLAAVLYLMVSGLFNSRNTSTDLLGVEMSTTGNGANWTLTVTSVRGTINQNDTRLTVLSPSGTVDLSARTLYSLETVTSGVRYVPASYGPITVNVGDQVFVSVATYPRGCQYTFADGGGVLVSGTFQ